MARRCATVAELVAIAPAFGDFGTSDVAQLVVDANPIAGDTITLLDEHGVLPVQQVFTAGTDFDIGADEEETAANIATALAGHATPLVTSTSIGATVYVASVVTGEYGKIGVTSSTADMVWSSATLTGGTSAIDQALSCTCSMINLEYWGVKASCGHAYLALHFLWLEGVANGTAGFAGDVKRRKIDKLEIDFAAFDPNSASDSILASSPWGRLYLAERKTLFVGPLVGRCTMVSLC